MSLEATISRLERKIDALSKPLWVNAETVKEKTGLDDKGMRRLRINNPDIWDRKKRGGGYLYNISMIPPVMIKNINHG